MHDYDGFLASKHVEAQRFGLTDLPSLDQYPLFPFQRDIVQWALRQGRAALFEECGLGKTLQFLSWTDALVRSGEVSRALILAPLAVAQQIVREGDKFGIKVAYARDQSEVTGSITVTNYERLERFDTNAFQAVVLDESSILKAFMGATKRRILESFAATRFKLACTATPAPNDHLELGNHGEFLGIMSSHEMIARWFINDTTQMGTYRLKHYAVESFWNWVTTWARCVGRPSDMGYEDGGFNLPDLHEHTHELTVDIVNGRTDGMLFRIPDLSATNVHQERKRTATERAQVIGRVIAAEPDEPWLIWCETDYEADAVAHAIPDVVDVRGSDSLEHKEEALMGFVTGKVKRLVTKPRLAGFGMNFQHCARVAFIGPTFSYEQHYQAVRRVWRFGQTRPVHVHMPLASTETGIWEVMRAKRKAHETMQESMFAAARRAQTNQASSPNYNPRHIGRLPAWLKTKEAA